MTVADPIPQIDAAAVARYSEVVFGYLDGLVPIRMLSETGVPQLPPKLEFPCVDKTASALTRFAPMAAREGRGLYVVPGTVANGGSARAEDIIQTGVLVIDIDFGNIVEKRAHLEQYLVPPTLVVASGGITTEGQDKLHLYWRLTEAAVGADLETVREIRETIAKKAGGDVSFASLHQPIRVAGSIHGKNGTLRPVRILLDTKTEYDLADLADAVAAMPTIFTVSRANDAGRATRKGPTAAQLATKVIRAGGLDGISRFDAISQVIGHWLRNVRNFRCNIDEAWAAICAHNSAMIVPPWEIPRLRHEFDAILARDIRNHGPMPHMTVSNGPSAARAVAPPAHSDDALAAAFVAMHVKHWRYVAIWGGWFHWTGTHWQRDETGLVREVVRQVCRVAADGADRPNDARRIASDKTIAAVLRVAAADPRVATRAEDWDAHPMLLNTPAGIIDLTTGERAPTDSARLLTQITKASPGSGCPRWLVFLEEVTGGDRDLQDYLQRLAGYCLTGDTSEQVFAFLHGTGANGKSVFLDTIAHVMGSYAATAASDTFMDTRATRHLTEIAGLRAARLVLVSETENGRGWAESRIKTVTGGETLRANFMHRDHFEFRPQFKLLVAGNHRPALSSVGEAMRRRLHLVPFDVTIPLESRVKGLARKLLEEKDGIFGWMLEGCAGWLRSGLLPPRRVIEAAEDYFACEDLVGQWINECCQLGIGLKAASDTLFRSWKAWADAGGFEFGTKKSLGAALRTRGLRDGKVGPGRGWHGIAVARSQVSKEGAE